MPPEQFAVFDVVLKKRGRAWRWCVCTTEQAVIMQGLESYRRAAKYKANRALFLLLCATHRSARTGCEGHIPSYRKTEGRSLAGRQGRRADP